MPYKCEQCGKPFNWPLHLIRHEVINTGKKHNKCKKCAKAFNQLSYLTEHEIFHVGEKPYKCKEGA